MSPPAAAAQLRMKRNAANRAVLEVKHGMRVGLGSGSTAELAIEALAARVAEGLRISAIASSPRSAALALRLKLPLTDFAAIQRLDLTIDGADQVEQGSLTLIKGLGGALLHEMIVATASDRMIVVVDRSKLVTRLGRPVPLPVEIVAFGWQALLPRLAELGLAPRLRRSGEAPVVTASGNLIVDCDIAEIADAEALQRQLRALVGVVETGLFIGMADSVVVGHAADAEVIERG